MENKITVAISKFSPLIMEQSGKLAGFEIELWEAIAKDIGLNFQYQKHNFQELIPLLATKKADVALAGITITEEREEIIDFSYPTLSSGLAILISRNRNKINVLGTIKSFLAAGYKKILTPLLILVAYLIIFGNLFWLAERNAGTFTPGYIPGIFQSFWLVISTITSNTFGDFLPHTWIGRVLTSIEDLTGLALFGFIVAELTAFLTIRKIKLNISSEKDLVDKTVATVKGSTSVKKLTDLKASVVPVIKIEDGYKKLENNEVDAVVFDAPILYYYEKNEGAGKAEIAGDLFDKQNYGIALQPQSQLREPINRAILKLRENGFYDSLHKKWFGEETKTE